MTPVKSPDMLWPAQGRRASWPGPPESGLSATRVFKLTWLAYGVFATWWLLSVGMFPFGWPRLTFVGLAAAGVFLSRGWARAGWSLLVFGASLNIIVQSFNGGAMPIAPWCAPVWDAVVPPYRYGGTLWWFGDVLGPCAVTVVSAGDLMVLAGMPLVALWWLKGARLLGNRARQLVGGA